MNSVLAVAFLVVLAICALPISYLVDGVGFAVPEIRKPSDDCVSTHSHHCALGQVKV